jgi:hypothetical protein
MGRAEERKGMANRVLDAALELGLRHPKSEVAIETIAEQAGLSFWQAYRCFTNQENLYRAAIARLVTRIESDLEEAPRSAANVFEAIRLYVAFAAAVVRRDPYVHYIQIAIRDRRIEPLLEEAYEARIVAKVRNGLEQIVRDAGARHGLVILLPPNVADSLLKTLETELVLPRLLPRFVEPAPGDVEKLVSRLATEAMAATFVVGAQAA